MMKAAVLGAGYMGSAIAQVCAKHGIPVFMWDISEHMLTHGLENIQSSLKRQCLKNRITVNEAERTFKLILPTTELKQVEQCEFVIESVKEDLQIKTNILKQVEKSVSDKCIIATNTSYLSVNELAESLNVKSRFLGMHFFAPVLSMKLVELVKSIHTNEDTVQLARQFAIRISKTPIVLNKDTPGFLVNRVNSAIRVEAYKCYEEGIASIEDIDTALKLGLNHPMGPFELNDMSGLDIGFYGLKSLYEQTKDARWIPPEILLKKIKDKELGVKTGKGWYDYSSGSKK